MFGLIVRVLPSFFYYEITRYLIPHLAVLGLPLALVFLGLVALVFHRIHLC